MEGLDSDCVRGEERCEVNHRKGYVRHEMHQNVRWGGAESGHSGGCRNVDAFSAMKWRRLGMVTAALAYLARDR